MNAFDIGNLSKLSRVFGAVLCLVLSTVVASKALCQESPPPESSAEVLPDQDLKPEAPDKVDVKPVARDEEISSRLTSILKSTEWFDAAGVEVENGVVFLSGKADEEEFKVWASNLARNTQDVAAVVNRMTVRESSIWDFSEAFAELRAFRTSAIQAIPLVIFGIVVLIATCLLAKLASVVASRLLTASIPNALLRWVVSHAVMLPILIFGTYLVLRISGLTQLALTVLGGTGLIGLVIGIAFQDIAENFLASILISIQKPFRIGDLITVEGHEGVVRRVTTRGTTLMSLDGNLVQIPNSAIYKATIVNFTANPSRRVSFEIGIGYDDSTTEAQNVILDKVKSHTSTLDDPPPRVLIESLAAATVNLRVLFWINGELNDCDSVRSSVMRICKQALQKRGISLPDESREVIFPNGVPVTMNPDSPISDSVAPSPNNEKSSKVERPTEKKQKSQTAYAEQPEEEVATEAEGRMKSESSNLERQADNSWLPGDGAEVLVEEEEKENSPQPLTNS